MNECTFHDFMLNLLMIMNLDFFYNDVANNDISIKISQQYSISMVKSWYDNVCCSYDIYIYNGWLS